jgi:hypothetical protein
MLVIQAMENQFLLTRGALITEQLSVNTDKLLLIRGDVWIEE